MVDLSQDEIAAMIHAGEQAGEYLDALEKTDLASLSEDEWMSLIEVIVTGFGDKLREIESDRSPPF